MGLNFYIGCHKCEEKIFLYRGKESNPMHAFYKEHNECFKLSQSNLEIVSDYGFYDWIDDDDSEYETNVDIEAMDFSDEQKKLHYN